MRGGLSRQAKLLSSLQVLDRLPPSYLRVVRLVCRQWERAAARLLRHLRPEALEGVELSRRFPHLHTLDLSQCMAAVEFAAPKRLRLQVGGSVTVGRARGAGPQGGSWIYIYM